jgi:archaeosine tRNA-ribosyltransferase (EC 2.4.2.-)
MALTFETRLQDAAGRIGRLSVPSADCEIETPTLLPVVNPNVQTVEADELAAAGAEMVITNAYIIYTTPSLRARAQAEGLSGLVGFDGPIMTDSGSFQLARYGEIEVDTTEIIEFQAAIGSDIATPVDLPTAPDASVAQAEEEVQQTEEAIARAVSMETGEMAITGPIQGSTHPSLRRQAGAAARALGCDLYAIGAVVPLLNSYRYAEMVDVIVAAKEGLGPAVPVHLFGAGHPMMFALAVAAGCDLFDSAAYALYARDGRYLTVAGTVHLDELSTLPCACPVCVGQSPQALAALSAAERERQLALHNLYVSFAEVRRVRAAVSAGNLLELVERRARGHPALLDGYRRLLAHGAYLERHDRASKGGFFGVSREAADRPEVARHHQRITAVPVGAEVLITEGDCGATADFDSCWQLVPPFGPVPTALRDTYPTNATLPAGTTEAERTRALAGVRRLVRAHPDSSFTLAHRGWPASTLAGLQGDVVIVDLTE